jgi:hypothetical protein
MACYYYVCAGVNKHVVCDANATCVQVWINMLYVMLMLPVFRCELCGGAAAAAQEAPCGRGPAGEGRPLLLEWNRRHRVRRHRLPGPLCRQPPGWANQNTPGGGSQSEHTWGSSQSVHSLGRQPIRKLWPPGGRTDLNTLTTWGRQPIRIFFCWSLWGLLLVFIFGCRGNILRMVFIFGCRGNFHKMVFIWYPSKKPKS